MATGKNLRKLVFILFLLNLIGILQMIIWDANELFVVGIISLIFIINAFIFRQIIRQKNQTFLSEKKELSFRIKNVGKYVFENTPIGIILYDNRDKISWSNQYAKDIFKREIDNQDLASVNDLLHSMSKTSKRTFEFNFHDSVYLINHKKDEKVLYFENITSYAMLMNKYEDSRATLGLIVTDNYEEVVKNLSEQSQNDYRRQITDCLANWAKDNGILFRTLRDGRFLVLMNHKTLNNICNERFNVLDQIRNIGKNEVTLTVSMGIASGYDSYIASFNRASSLVDLALSRGGDQVVIKKKGVDDFLFYGGKTNPIASQNRVRSRVNAGAYERLILDSDKVIIMGHRFPDADAIGASIGLAKVASLLGKKAHIVLNKTELDKANAIFIEEVLKNESLNSYFISNIKAVELMSKNTLLVIADTQSSNLVIDSKLLRLTNKIAIFDHHRRNSDFIEATLSYTDPSVSSTVELVVDMFDYFSKPIDLSSAEASIMLAGIMLDTRRFMYNTSKKTYEAAAILKQKGADEKYVSKLLKAPIDHYYSRAHLTHRARVFENDFLISSASEDLMFDRTELAATADDLLNVQGIKASFVLGYVGMNEVAISARSVGEINVQLIMEELGGGGHLTNAATRYLGNVRDASAALENVLLNLKR